MITLLGAFFTIVGIGLLLQGSWWAVALFVLGGVLWVVGDSVDDDMAFLGGFFLWIFFGVCTYVIIKQAATWMCDLIMFLVSLSL